MMRFESSGRYGRAAIAMLTCAMCLPAVATNTLVGFAKMDADTFAPGPTSGQFQAPANGVVPPYVNKQVVQGFSAVLHGPSRGTYYVMPDNGFGSKNNSQDYVLRMYAVMPEFRTAKGGSGKVLPADFRSGKVLDAFSARSFISLSDPKSRLSFTTVASAQHYPYFGTPQGSESIPVDPRVREDRLLTGADFDIEAVRRDKHCNFWFGDEFGPFLVKTDARGRVLRSEIPLPNFSALGANPLVQSPDSPHLHSTGANLPRSGGFEGVAMNASGDKLYSLLERPMTGDADQKRLIISEFDIKKERYTGRTFFYKLEVSGTNIGDMTAINDHEYLVIERNGIQGTQPNAADMFKKIYKIDLRHRDAAGFVAKSELVDLLKIADPHDLNGDGKALFDFPFVTIEDVLVVDETTLLVINDNNYPGNGGRSTTGPDSTEFILVRLEQPLHSPRRDRRADAKRCETHGVDHRRH